MTTLSSSNRISDQLIPDEDAGLEKSSPQHRSRESSFSTSAESETLHSDNSTSPLATTEEDLSGEKVETLADITWSVALRPRNLYKLITHEDFFHLHKLVGVIALTHYLFRLGSL